MAENNSQPNKGKLFLAHLALGGMVSSITITERVATQQFIIQPEIRSVPQRAIEFALRDQLRMIFLPPQREKEMNIFGQFAINTIIGSGIGAFTHSVRVPIEISNNVWNHNLMAQGDSGKLAFKTRFEMFKKLGPRIFYENSEFTKTFTIATLYTGIYFGVYDTLKSTLGDKTNLGVSLLCGLAASSSAVLATSTIGHSLASPSTLNIKNILRTFTAQKNLGLLVTGAVALPLYDQLKLLFIEERREKNPTQLTTVAMDAALSASAAATARFCVAPLERSVLMQTVMMQFGRGHNTLLEIMKTTIKDSGIGSMWRGTVANIQRYAPVQATNFATKDLLEHSIFYTDKNDFFAKKLACNMAAGGVAGVISLTLWHPYDTARAQMATEIANARKLRQPVPNTTTLDTILKIARTDVKGLYKNYGVTVIGTSVYRALYFGLYDTLKTTLNLNSSPILFPIQCLLAYATTFTASVAVLPIDIVRRYIILQNTQNVILTPVQATKAIIKNDGTAGLFKGTQASFYRSVAGSGVLVLYDLLQSLAYQNNKE